ncbi:MAG: T9SS type A sorting domain-containing protein [Candidatus Kapabacteria bacterium]|nr:T9SS type A sorting domain-containing protein [Candidatus Kapabacteria bacterium]
MKKSILIIFLLPCLLLSFSGKGSGTEADPFQITTMVELQEINDNPIANYILMNDLDATGVKFNKVNLRDKGSLNGNGHIIRHLNRCGLFFYCSSCKITKLGIEYDTIQCNNNSGFIDNVEGYSDISECYTAGVLIDPWAGFCELNYGLPIMNCYSSCTLTSTTGKIKSRGFVYWGGSSHCYFSGYLAGEGKHDFFYSENNYWNKDFYPRPDTFISKGIGKTTAEMYQRSTYKGWDFCNVWCMEDGFDYPRLRAFNNCPPSVFFSGKGSGTKDDPYQITTLKQIVDIKNLSCRSYFILMNDIDASETRYWNVGDHDSDASTPDEPMGWEPVKNQKQTAYIPSFDGNGHIIKNLYINRPKEQNVCVFNACGTIRKLGLEDCDIKGFSGGFVNQADIIEQCYITGKMHFKYKPSYNFDFGSFYYKLGDHIQNCYSSCDLSYDSTDVPTYYKDNGYKLVLTCYFNGTVKAKDPRVFSIYFNYRNYFDKEKAKIPDTVKIDNVFGLPTLDMFKKRSFQNWDFDSVWCIDEGKDYPRLRAFNKCAPVSVQESYADNRQQPVVQSIEISPNPATDDIKITVETRHAVSLHISLYSALGEDLSCIIEDGRVLAVSEINSGIYKYSKSISSRQLSSGMYYVRIRSDYGSITKPITIIK